jgi:hypothetical protein
MMKRAVEQSRLVVARKLHAQAGINAQLDAATPLLAEQQQLGMVLRDKACHMVVALACDPQRWARHAALSNGYRAALWAAADHFELKDLGYQHVPRATAPQSRDPSRAPPFARPKFRRALTAKLVRADEKGKQADFGAWAAPILHQWHQAALKEQRQQQEQEQPQVSYHHDDRNPVEPVFVGEHAVPLPSVAELNEFYHTSKTTDICPGSDCCVPIRPCCTAHACTKHIFVLESLCACLWPVVEALIVLDRLQYTREMLGQEQEQERKQQQPETAVQVEHADGASMAGDTVATSGFCQWDVGIEEAFPSELSPRNLAIVIRRRT